MTIYKKLVVVPMIKVYSKPIPGQILAISANAQFLAKRGETHTTATIGFRSRVKFKKHQQVISRSVLPGTIAIQR